MKRNARIFLMKSADDSDCLAQLRLIEDTVQAGFTIIGIYNGPMQTASLMDEMARLIEDIQPMETLVFEEKAILECAPQDQLKEFVQALQAKEGAYLWLYEELPFYEVQPPLPPTRNNRSIEATMSNAFLRSIYRDFLAKVKEQRTLARKAAASKRGPKRNYRKIEKILSGRLKGVSGPRLAKQYDCAVKTIYEYQKDFNESGFDSPTQFVEYLKELDTRP